MDPFLEYNLMSTRRMLLGKTAAGIGAAALTSLLNPSLFSAPAGKTVGGFGFAAFCTQSQARDLPVSIRRSGADGFARLQAAHCANIRARNCPNRSSKASA